MSSTDCSNTGLTVPECSCGDCVRQLLDEFAPHLVRQGVPGYDESADESSRDAQNSPVTA